MPRLMRFESDTPEGKYLVTRRDGTVPEWMWFVLGSRDPASLAALRAYANEAEKLGYDKQFVRDVRHLSVEFLDDLQHNGETRPDDGAKPVDDPETVGKMVVGKSA